MDLAVKEMTPRQRKGFQITASSHDGFDCLLVNSSLIIEREGSAAAAPHEYATLELISPLRLRLRHTSSQRKPAQGNKSKNQEKNQKQNGRPKATAGRRSAFKSSTERHATEDKLLVQAMCCKACNRPPSRHSNHQRDQLLPYSRNWKTSININT